VWNRYLSTLCILTRGEQFIIFEMFSESETSDLPELKYHMYKHDPGVDKKWLKKQFGMRSDESSTETEQHPKWGPNIYIPVGGSVNMHVSAIPTMPRVAADMHRQAPLNSPIDLGPPPPSPEAIFDRMAQRETVARDQIRAPADPAEFADDESEEEFEFQPPPFVPSVVREVLDPKAGKKFVNSKEWKDKAIRVWKDQIERHGTFPPESQLKNFQHWWIYFPWWCTDPYEDIDEWVQHVAKVAGNSYEAPDLSILKLKPVKDLIKEGERYANSRNKEAKWFRSYRLGRKGANPR
jgi:hypothetical protein